MATDEITGICREFTVFFSRFMRQEAAGNHRACVYPMKLYVNVMSLNAIPHSSYLIPCRQ